MIVPSMDSNAIKTSIQIPPFVGSQTAVNNTGKEGYMGLPITFDYIRLSTKNQENSAV